MLAIALSRSVPTSPFCSPGDTYYQTVHTLRGLLPAPVTDTPVEPPLPNSRTGQEWDRAIADCDPNSGLRAPQRRVEQGLRRR